MFVNKVKETEAELKEKEKEVRMDVSRNQCLELFDLFKPLTDCRTLPVVSSSTRGLSSSNGCTRRKRRLWRRKDGSWRRRWTLSIVGRLQLRRWWDRRSKAARSPSKRTRTRRSKFASLGVCGVDVSENNIAPHKTRPFRMQLWNHCEQLLRKTPKAHLHWDDWSDLSQLMWLMGWNECLPTGSVGFQQDVGTDSGWHCVPWHYRRGQSVHDSSTLVPLQAGLPECI